MRFTNGSSSGGIREDMQYNKLADGKGFTFNPEEVTLKMACCDCGLVHYMGITVLPDKSVSVGFKVDKRATGQLRRNNYGNLSQDGRLAFILKENRKATVMEWVDAL